MILQHDGGGGLWSTGAQPPSPWQTGNVQIDVGDPFRLASGGSSFLQMEIRLASDPPRWDTTPSACTIL